MRTPGTPTHSRSAGGQRTHPAPDDLEEPRRIPSALSRSSLPCRGLRPSRALPEPPSGPIGKHCSQCYLGGRLRRPLERSPVGVLAVWISADLSDDEVGAAVERHLVEHLERIETGPWRCVPLRGRPGRLRGLFAGSLTSSHEGPLSVFRFHPLDLPGPSAATVPQRTLPVVDHQPEACGTPERSACVAASPPRCVTGAGGGDEEDTGGGSLSRWAVIDAGSLETPVVRSDRASRSSSRLRDSES